MKTLVRSPRKFGPILMLITLILGPVALNFSPLLAQKLFKGLDLTGSWEFCISKTGDASSNGAPAEDRCIWKTVRSPGKLPFVENHDNATILLRKMFPTPDFCSHVGGACELLVGTLSDPTDAFLNGIHIGRIGQPPPSPQYSQTYPARFFMAESVLHSSGQNELILELYPMKQGKYGVHGITRSPLAIYPSRISGLLAETLTAGTVFLPLFSSFGLLTLVALTLMAGRINRFSDKTLAAYMRYCLFSGVYLVSLSRVPREYIPQPVGLSIHFGLRFLLEMFLLRFVSAFFHDRRILTQIITIGLIVASGLCFLTAFNQSTGQSWVTLFSSWGVFLCPYTAGVGLFLAIKSFRVGTSSNAAIIPLFFFLLLMQCWDITALHGFLPDIYFGRFSPLIIGIFFGYFFWQKAAEETQKIEVDAKLGAVTAQVAHDIRSPLAALEMSLEDLSSLPEDIRLIVKSALGRITDISNNLLTNYQAPINKGRTPVEGTPKNDEDNNTSVVLLSSLVEPLLSEKRKEFRTKLGIEIHSNLTLSSYGLFAKIQAVEFKRVLSNLVNNAVVHGIDDNGKITVEVSERGGLIEIQCTDNGKGMPPKIVEKLGERGETHGSGSGSGLGLYHARTSLQSWGGTFSIVSAPGKGTSAILTLPKGNPPSWFVPSIQIARNSTVVVLDDDASIHYVWDKRLDSIRQKDQNVKIAHFSTPTDLLQWHQGSPPSEVLYLVDYELIGQNQTGLDIIESLKIAPQSILVTSRFEDPTILDRCLRLGIKLLPKGLAGIVPIQLEAADRGKLAVLLDNDVLVQETWAMWAKRAGISLVTFSSEEELFEGIGGIPKIADFYIDYELENRRNGVEVAKELFHAGFKNITLVTGHRVGKLEVTPWTIAVTGKHCPWKIQTNAGNPALC